MVDRDRFQLGTTSTGETALIPRPVSLLPKSPAERFEMLIDMGPPRLVRYDEDTGEPIYRGAGLLSDEQVKRLLRAVGE
jgi:hypothetical protein